MFKMKEIKNMLPKIISFSGRKGSGKSLLTLYLKDKYNYKIVNFADELKYLVCKILCISPEFLEGTKDKQSNDLQTYMIQNMEFICNLLHEETSINKNIIEHVLRNTEFSSIRTVLQVVGTDLIRAYNPDWHINKIKQKLNKDEYYCFGDTRFKNEKQFIESMNGSCWFIIRPNNLNISNHISEIDLSWKDFNNNILINDNDTDKCSFEQQFESALCNGDNSSVFNKYNDKININRFYEIPNAQIYNLFLTHGTFEKDNNNNNNIYFTLKNCSESDHYLFKTYLESKDIVFNPNKRKRHGCNDYNRYECDSSDSSFVFKCNNPFIIENLKLYIH